LPVRLDHITPNRFAGAKASGDGAGRCDEVVVEEDRREENERETDFQGEAMAAEAVMAEPPGTTRKALPGIPVCLVTIASVNHPIPSRTRK
jgi:hypothetical protein